MTQSAPNRILVRGVNWLGDAVMTTPALQRLRERFPKAYIALLAPEKLADLWLGHPGIDSVLRFSPHESVWRIGRRLREEAFQIALILPNSPRSALEIWWGRIPQRIGYARPWRNWFLTEALLARPQRITMRKRPVGEIKRLVRTVPDRSEAGLGPSAGAAFPVGNAEGTGLEWLGAVHQVHEYLHLAAAMGADPAPVPPRLVVSPEEVRTAASKLLPGEATGAGRPLFALNPGAEYGAAKRWPVSRFAAVAQAVQQQKRCRWLILGGQGDVSLANEIAEALKRLSPPPLNLAGKTSLRELCAVLKLCQVFLTNDTGPMHVAAALGTRVVALFGSTSAALTGPALPGESLNRVLTSTVVCAPCFRRTCPIDFRCMTRISVDSVVEAVLGSGV